MKQQKEPWLSIICKNYKVKKNRREATRETKTGRKLEIG